MRVTIRGTTYSSVKEAADALGVSPATVYCGIIRGNPERIGLGPDYEARPRRGGRAPKALTIGGQRFESLADLARFLGREPRNLRASLLRGTLARRRILLAVMKKQAEASNAHLRQQKEEKA